MEWLQVIGLFLAVFALAKGASLLVDWLDAHQLGPIQDDDDDWPDLTA